MSDNLLKIGMSGVLASNGLLATTSNNIANLNTQGFVRQRTEYESSILGLGVGRGTTERLVNEFTLKQLRRDTSNLAYSEMYLAEASRIDSLFSNSANSLAKGMTNLFNQLQTANNDPSNNSARQLMLGSSQSLVNTFNTLSTLVLEQGSYINQQLDIFVSEANTVAGLVAKFNKEIAGYGTGPTTPPPLDLMDKRDEALRKLAEMMDITTIDSPNGEKLVFLSTGQSLVLQDGRFNMLSTEGDPDVNRKVVKLQLDFNSSVTDTINSTELGGKIGGLLDFRMSMLEPMQNKLGQLALALGDAFNTQNRLGMDANSTIGKDLFKLGSAVGLPLARNTGLGQIQLVVEPGEGKNIPPNDLQVVFTAPDQMTVSALDNEGKVLAGSAITQTINATGNVIYGYRITMDTSAGPFGNNDTFVLKPLGKAAQNIALATTRPEDIALASPIKGDFAINNLGNARFGKIEVTNTDPDPATSQFNAAGNSFAGAPLRITYLGGDQFEIRDNANALLGTAGPMAGGQYNNLMAAASLGNYGFDFSLTGVPKLGDSFTVSFNTGGYKDNRNGLALAALQSGELVRKNAVTSASADNSLTMNESYGSMIGFIGDKTSQSRVAAESSKSLLTQSTAWYESSAGVNLDEEAANLIRFQQTYAAAAKIISTSQTIFDTLLAAAR